MNCPVCKTTQLVMSDRQGIEIDYCPQCRGIWLDRGELDKIIQRSAREEIPSDRGFQERGPRDDDDYKYGHKKKKRESFLEDLFDF